MLLLLLTLLSVLILSSALILALPIPHPDCNFVSVATWIKRAFSSPTSAL
ncbi:secreted protein [Candidatus Magnetoovum chiemensis]|nr:secreted protein [Candidatus Magnetoovum chiemensis]